MEANKRIKSFSKRGLFCLFLFFIVFCCISCKDSSTPTGSLEGTSVGGAVLETGYEIDENMEIIDVQTTFKPHEDFYFSFYNNQPFGDDTVTVELYDTRNGKKLADGAYEVGSEWATFFDMVWFSDPGKYLISVKVGDQLRATQEVLIEE